MMKLRIIVSLCFLGLSVAANAQKADSSANKSIEKIYLYTNVKGKPIIVIDGSIYSESNRPFDVNDILRYTFLKPPGSTNIYGQQAADGAILITSKNLLKSDTTKYSSIKSDSVIYVLDGELSNKRAISVLNPHSILSIDILKKDKNSIFDGLSRNDVFVIITKAYATKCYQEKISSLLKEYKEYLKNHHQDDERLSFVINGKKYVTSSDDRIKRLYDLFADNKTYQNFSLKIYYGVRSDTLSC
jgi:hypothetical protein